MRFNILQTFSWGLSIKNWYKFQFGYNLFTSSYNPKHLGWTEVELYCYRKPKFPGHAIRREMIKQCFFIDGQYTCWQHWSSNHLLDGSVG